PADGWTGPLGICFGHPAQARAGCAFRHPWGGVSIRRAVSAPPSGSPCAAKPPPLPASPHWHPRRGRTANRTRRRQGGPSDARAATQAPLAIVSLLACIAGRRWLLISSTR